MWKAGRLALLTVSMVAFAPAAPADDAAILAKLVGAWEGKWAYGEMGGKLTAKFVAGSGTALKGETTWFGTAVGDFSDKITKVKVKDGKVSVSEPTMDFEVTLSEDGNAMEGTWTSPVASGPMTLKRKVN